MLKGPENPNITSLELIETALAENGSFLETSPDYTIFAVQDNENQPYPRVLGLIKTLPLQPDFLPNNHIIMLLDSGADDTLLIVEIIKMKQGLITLPIHAVSNQELSNLQEDSLELISRLSATSAHSIEKALNNRDSQTLPTTIISPELIYLSFLLRANIADTEPFNTQPHNIRELIEITCKYIYYSSINTLEDLREAARIARIDHPEINMPTTISFILSEMSLLGMEKAKQFKGLTKSSLAKGSISNPQTPQPPAFIAA